MKSAQFKDLTFKSKKAFDKWLKETTDKIIILDDMGQDMQRINVHSSGEILDCDFHSSAYNGKFVNMDSLQEFAPIEICIHQDEGYRPFYKLVVSEIKQP